MKTNYKIYISIGFLIYLLFNVFNNGFVIKPFGNDVDLLNSEINKSIEAEIKNNPDDNDNKNDKITKNPDPSFTPLSGQNENQSDKEDDITKKRSDENNKQGRKGKDGRDFDKRKDITNKNFQRRKRDDKSTDSKIDNDIVESHIPEARKGMPVSLYGDRISAARSSDDFFVIR